MEKQNKKYSIDFKIKAVELSNHRGETKSVAQELDIPTDSLRKWKGLFRAGKLSSSGISSVRVKSKEELENIALRKALKDAEMERDILKKALGIFSKRDV